MGDTFILEVEEMLSFIDLNGEEGFDSSRIELLEGLISDCNKNMNDLESVQVADSIYDALYSMLKKIKPNSNIFSEIWEKDGDITDHTELLVINPMMSIETAKSYFCNEMIKFLARAPREASYFASYKINGHGIRIVYKDGYLVSATSRARSSGGRDLTRHMCILLGDFNENLQDLGLVEIRGEVALKIDRLEDAREFNPDIKSAFSGVSALIKPSASEPEIKLLSFLAYGFICEDFKFDSKDDVYQTLLDCGFQTPEYSLIESISKDDLLETIKAIVTVFEENYEEFGYFCDGVVFEVNDTGVFKEMGTENSHNCGNIALKVGVWEQVQYSGVVNKIYWTKGKNKLTPVAIVSDNMGDLEVDEDGEPTNLGSIGVLTSQGNRVKRVPLYEPKNIIILDAYEGEVIFFRYGGESGVVPCFPDGRLLKEDEAKEILTEEKGWDNWDND